MPATRFSVTLCAALLATAARAETTVTIDANAGRHAISPLIYGTNFATKAQLQALGAPLNRSGGNATSAYNWNQNATNLARDWYFESYPDQSAKPGADADSFVSLTKGAGAEPMLTVPLMGWVAKLGANRSILPSFSVAKYGAQCDADYWDSDAGNGFKPDCSTPITGNDPSDAFIADTPADEQKWIRHLVKRWGTADAGGVRYYLMDNEPSIWFDTHRDVHPVGPHGTEYRDKVIDASARIKAVDPGAKIAAPEEWGWEAYFYSGYDQQYAPNHGWTWPDHEGVQGGMDYIPWLLGEWKKAGHPVDILSLHFYPQAGEYGSDHSRAMQLLRNRSTRQLWDPNYTSESWIGQPVYLIPRMKAWIASAYYAGTPTAITEYSWGAEDHINGATTQADVLGIFGREGLDLATRWTTPKSNSPTFKAMQMYRNYDGVGSGFGDTSVQASVTNPDKLSAFAALRGSDGAMTVMVINKEPGGGTPVRLKLGNFAKSGTAKVWRLTAANKIEALPDTAWSAGSLRDTAPAQSITLYVLK